jgi:hypothetical protein
MRDLVGGVLRCHRLRHSALKARQNPRGLSQIDGYKRGLVNSLTGNLQKFGLDRMPKIETLEEVLQDD